MAYRMGIRVAPTSRAKLEVAAARVRQVLELGAEDAIPGLVLFERLENYASSTGGREVPLTYGVCDLPMDVEAATRYVGGVIRIDLSPRTYEDLEREDPRARFTLAHEIGHAALHAAELVRLSQIPHQERALLRGGEHRVFENSEWQADNFAGALLMPASGIRSLVKRLGAKARGRISETYKVSAACSSVRWEVLAPTL